MLPCPISSMIRYCLRVFPMTEASTSINVQKFTPLLRSCGQRVIQLHLGPCAASAFLGVAGSAVFDEPPANGDCRNRKEVFPIVPGTGAGNEELERRVLDEVTGIDGV